MPPCPGLMLLVPIEAGEAPRLKVPQSVTSPIKAAVEARLPAMFPRRVAVGKRPPCRAAAGGARSAPPRLDTRTHENRTGKNFGFN